MARTRTTIRRIDPWSILKFGFVANLVLLGIELLAGIVVWYVIQRLELIQTVCELAATVGFEECGVDGGALFDTVLVLGLLGVVIQTGIMVFLAFLANLIFDLTGGIVVTLEDDRAPGTRPGRSGGVGARATGAAAMSRASRGDGTRSGRDGTGSVEPAGSSTSGETPVSPLGSDSSQSDTTSTASTTATTSTTGATSTTSGDRGGGSSDDTLFGGS